MDSHIFYDEVGQKGFPLLDDAKSDSEFFLAPQRIFLNFGPFSNNGVYYNAQDADFVPIVSGGSGNACSFSDPSDCIDDEYVDQTNTQLFAEHENSYLGVITPVSAVPHPIVVGGKVDSIANNIVDLEEESDCLTLYPNPTSDYFKIEGDFNNYSIQILSSDGTLYQNVSNQNSPIEIDLSSLPNGLYFVKVVNLQNSDICIQQIIKTN